MPATHKSIPWHGWLTCLALTLFGGLLPALLLNSCSSHNPVWVERMVHGEFLAEHSDTLVVLGIEGDRSLTLVADKEIIRQIPLGLGDVAFLGWTNAGVQPDRVHAVLTDFVGTVHADHGETVVFRPLNPELGTLVDVTASKPKAKAGFEQLRANGDLKGRILLLRDVWLEYMATSEGGGIFSLRANTAPVPHIEPQKLGVPTGAGLPTLGDM